MRVCLEETEEPRLCLSVEIWVAEGRDRLGDLVYTTKHFHNIELERRKKGRKRSQGRKGRGQRRKELFQEVTHNYV